MHWKTLGVLLTVSLLGWAAETRAQPSDTELRLRALEKKLAATEEEDKSQLRVVYDNGLKIMSGDGKLKLMLGGRIMHDSTWGTQSDMFIATDGEVPDGSIFRRTCFFMSGILYDRVLWKFDIDVGANNSQGITFKDVWIGYRRIPFLGTFQVGHFKRPASLDSVTSSKYLQFIERSLTNTFFKTRNTGFAFSNHHLDGRLRWKLFINQTTSERPPTVGDNSKDSVSDSALNIQDGQWNVTGRLTGIPVYLDHGRRVLHLGLSYSYENDQVLGGQAGTRFRGARDTEITRRFLDTGVIDSKFTHILGFEGMIIYGPWTLQGEYVFADVHRTIAGTEDAFLDAFYAHATYWLTGEQTQYKKACGCVGRFKVNNNFFTGDGGIRGWGAWQVGVRYAQVDMDDPEAMVFGGKQQSLTLGLNWHLYSQARMMYNFVHARFYSQDGSDPTGTLNQHIVRFQIDW